MCNSITEGSLGILGRIGFIAYRERAGRHLALGYMMKGFLLELVRDGVIIVSIRMAKWVLWGEEV
jgi:hypothetical protein